MYLRFSNLLIIKEQDFIPNIQSYCDRWCERCELTARCEIFTSQEVGPVRPMTSRMIHADFEKALDRFYQLAHAKKLAIEELDPGSPDEMKRREKNRTNPRTNETSKLANDYRLLVLNFKSIHRSEIEQYRQLAISRTELSLKGDGTTLNLLETALDGIYWYELQFPVKITRAYLGAAEESPETSDSLQRDWNGSAKVALLCIETSFVAWAMLLTMLPELEAICLQAMQVLDRIRKRLQTDFPDWNRFVRPGFDKLATIQTK